MTPDGKILVAVAGLSKKPGKGKMARLVAEAIEKQQNMCLSCIGLSEEDDHTVVDGTPAVVRLFSTEHHEDALKEAKEHGVDLVVDTTLPTAVNRNAELYCAAKMPFVMLTTGGDRAKLVETVQKSDTYAVIATNMSVPVVMFQQMLKFVAGTFPGALKGFKLLIQESHQAAKKDVSGTAVGLLDYFKALGMPLTTDQIKPERDPVVQELGWGIPAGDLGGHGDHIYTMLSPDGSVLLQFQHRVLGRQTYVDGALRAIRFVVKHPNAQGRVFDMLDVLKG